MASSRAAKDMFPVGSEDLVAWVAGDAIHQLKDLYDLWRNPRQ